jgi:hypothetical protein
MHLTLKLEATKPAAQNFLQQQARFDDFIAQAGTSSARSACDSSSVQRKTTKPSLSTAP